MSLQFVLHTLYSLSPSVFHPDMNFPVLPKIYFSRPGLVDKVIRKKVVRRMKVRGEKCLEVKGRDVGRFCKVKSASKCTKRTLNPALRSLTS